MPKSSLFVKYYAEEYERALTDGRGQLDEATWEAAWAEGQAMSLEQAIAYALEPTAKVS